jgi:hypothetical protein
MTWQVYKLPTDRIYATYIGGDVKTGLAPDIESKNVWLKYLPKEFCHLGAGYSALTSGCHAFLRHCLYYVTTTTKSFIFKQVRLNHMSQKNKDKIRVKKKRKNK